MSCRGRKGKITVQEPTETIDSVGQPTQSWGTYTVRSAEIMTAGGREMYRLNQYFSEANIAFKVRYDSLTKGITTKMRISYDSRIFNIISAINKDEKNQEINIACTEDT